MIIAFVGKKEVGKTTACKMVKRKVGEVVHVNFKDALIAELRENFPGVLGELSKLTGMTIRQMFIQKPPIMRKLLQNYGTDLRRGDDDLYWCRAWRLAVQAQKLSTTVLVDDVRFLNEALAIRNKGGILIRLERPDLTSRDTHSSEMEQDSIKADYTISVKAGEFKKLEIELGKVLKEVIHKRRTVG